MLWGSHLKIRTALNPKKKLEKVVICFGQRSSALNTACKQVPLYLGLLTSGNEKLTAFWSLREFSRQGTGLT